MTLQRFLLPASQVPVVSTRLPLCMKLEQYFNELYSDCYQLKLIYPAQCNLQGYNYTDLVNNEPTGEWLFTGRFLCPTFVLGWLLKTETNVFTRSKS